jgi:cytochrome c oxidase subunit 4
MSEPIIRVRDYVLVCILLVLLTILTVGLSFLQVSPVWHLVMGLGIALCKASLVVLVFMHALVNQRLIWIVISICILWMGILFILTLTDYFTRGMILIAPGH